MDLEPVKIITTPQIFSDIILIKDETRDKPYFYECKDGQPISTEESDFFKTKKEALDNFEKVLNSV